MSYIITAYTRRQAKKLGVSVKKSSNPKKKIDVFNKEGKKIASVGAIGYKDYPTFLREDGKEVADKRRKAYKSRHQKYRNKVGTNSYYADRLLW